MTTAGWIQLLVFLGLIFVVHAAARRLHGEGLGAAARRPATASSRPIERGHLPRSAGSIPRASSAGPSTRSRCSPSARSRCCSSTAFQRLQSHLPFNPDHLAAVHPDLAWNTAVSFVTNTNWQSYGGESTMSHLTQMAGLAVQNFVSAAAGLAVMVALIRGLTAPQGPHDRQLLGRPHPHDAAASCVPLAFVVAIVLASQGVIQNFHASTHVTTVAGGDADDPGWPGREPDRDQAARHERRRLLQHELGAPVREPERLHEHDRDVLHRHDPVRGDLRARRAGQEQAVRLGDLRRRCSC